MKKKPKKLSPSFGVNKSMEKRLKKLREFLQSHLKFKEECEVVYLMVEIRKILEYGESSYKTLRFYCNWVLHKELNQERTTKLLSDIFEKDINLEESGRKNAYNMKSIGVDFFKLNKFKKEFKDFLKDNNLPLNLAEKDWWTFIKLLLEIIKDCPIAFTPNKIRKLEIKKYTDNIFGYKFSLVGNNSKPVIKIKFK